MKYLLIILFIALLFASCKKEEEKTAANPEGKIVFHFLHQVDGQDLDIDTMKYVNAAGNHYLINEIQYFISDVTLHLAGGGSILIDEWKDIHYVDTDIPSTHTWEVYDAIQAGSYEYISFTFGISEEKNHSFMYVNPPESFMFWPEYLGGGYHYMKLNGKWLNEDLFIEPFDFHLGIGQILDTAGQITGFVHNDFEVVLPGSAFTLQSGETIDIDIIMNIENWFQDPNLYDHNIWGGYIMQNQEAMHVACENGWNVFEVGYGL
ncbi:MAG: hypothetical protein KKA81_14810 [Bacteroidetes bacterium]|nr:hypothetical protein [Bacteroidota bacterium]